MAAIIDTPLGPAIIEGDEKGISSFSFSGQLKSNTTDIPEELKNAVLQIKQYFSGERKAFRLKLNPAGTTFQKKVWEHLFHVPFGKTLSYSELTGKFGDPGVIRAVASASGKNPLLILIPCHRIIGSNGALTGYSGGLWRKKWLIEHEKGVRQEFLFHFDEFNPVT